MVALPEPGGAEPDLLAALLQDSNELAAVLEPDGRFRYLNGAGRRLLGLRADDPLPAGSAFELVAAVDLSVLEVALLPALEARRWWSGNLNLVTTTGGELPTRSTLRAWPAGDGDAPITWIARDVSTERAVYERLHKKVFEDEVTGLPHRSIFLDRLDLSLRRTHVGAPSVTLLVIGLDRFRDRTDRLEPGGRDELLRAVGQRLDALRTPSDSFSRWGDDEFVFLSEDGTGPDDRAYRVASAFADPFPVAGVDVYLTASIGAATGHPGSVSTDQLLRQADAAVQMARQRGGGALQRFDDAMQDRARRRAEVEDELRGAADRGELVLHYQPEVSLRTNRIEALEALVRWQHPDWGLVSPGEFVPVAEASNLILEVGAWVLQEATEQCGRWRARYGEATPAVAVNISARQFAQDDFVELVAGALERSGAEAGDLCLEITESILMDDLDRTIATLGRLKALGVQLAVDDFGTGYSSLSYLRRFPVDVLKVDQSFVSGLGHDAEDSAIVQAVVAMGRALRLTTVAEGVETGHHVIELRELDCDLAQGYHFARPRPADATTEVLDAGPDWLDITP
ncbi:MAG TPA: EAL domain-containing protein [Acidimicrobiales bacterium]|nr:EAL domain-containing protein [Acidimicrobiales bacterium]